MMIYNNKLKFSFLMSFIGLLIIISMSCSKQNDIWIGNSLKDTYYSLKTKTRNYIEVTDSKTKIEEYGGTDKIVLEGQDEYVIGEIYFSIDNKYDLKNIKSSIIFSDWSIVLSKKYERDLTVIYDVVFAHSPIVTDSANILMNSRIIYYQLIIQKEKYSIGLHRRIVENSIESESYIAKPIDGFINKVNEKKYAGKFFRIEFYNQEKSHQFLLDYSISNDKFVIDRFEQRYLHDSYSTIKTVASISALNVNNKKCIMLVEIFTRKNKGDRFSMVIPYIGESLIPQFENATKVIDKPIDTTGVKKNQYLFVIDFSDTTGKLKIMPGGT